MNADTRIEEIFKYTFSAMNHIYDENLIFFMKFLYGIVIDFKHLKITIDSRFISLLFYVSFRSLVFMNEWMTGNYKIVVQQLKLINVKKTLS